MIGQKRQTKSPSTMQCAASISCARAALLTPASACDTARRSVPNGVRFVVDPTTTMTSRHAPDTSIARIDTAIARITGATSERTPQ